MVLTTPLLAQLARRGPVDVVTTPASASLLANHPAVRDVIVVRQARRDRGRVRLHATRVATSRARGTTRRYLAQGSRAQRRARAARRAFRARRLRDVGGAAVLHDARRADRRPASRRAAAAARHARTRCEPSARRDFGRGSIRATRSAGGRRRCSRARRGDGERLIALAPGSVWATKRWPYYRRARARARATRAHRGRRRPRRIARSRARSSRRRTADAIDATGELSLLASAELIGRAALLVTNDSAPLHLASAMNTPTVAIFGPTVPEFGFGPLADRARRRWAYGRSACRPCDRHGPQRCPSDIGAACARLRPTRWRSRRARDLLTSDARDHGHEEATAVHHRRRPRRNEHRRRRDVGGRQAALRDALDSDERRSRAPKASPTASSG